MRKRVFAILLGALLCFCGCDRVTEHNSSEPSDISQEQSEKEYTTDTLIQIGEAFEVSGLYGKTAEQLTKDFDGGVFCNDNGLEYFLNTPVSLLFRPRSSRGLVSYDKTTGMFANACRDPLCTEHINCIWQPHWSYCYGEYLYFSDPETNILSRTDLYGNDDIVLYMGVSQPIDVKVLEGYTYFRQEYIDTETNQTKHLIKRVSIRGGRTDTLITQVGDDAYLRYLPIGGDKLMYTVQSEGITYLYDIANNTQTALGEGIILDACYGGYVYYSTDDGAFVSPVGDRLEGVRLAEELGELLCFNGGRAYFFKNTRTDGLDYSKRDLYSCLPDGTDLRLECEFTTDGQPDRVFTASVSDTLLCVAYRTYEDEQSAERFDRFALIDTETGERFEWTNKRP